MIERILIVAGALAIATLGPPPSPSSGASADRPVVFTQVHRDALPWWRGRWRPQRVPDRARVRVQLPGDPVRWRPAYDCAPAHRLGPSSLVPLLRLALTGRPPAPATATLIDQRVISNPDRVSGTTAIYQFDYIIEGPGTTAICLDPDPPRPGPDDLPFPPGSPPDYRLTLNVMTR